MKDTDNQPKNKFDWLKEHQWQKGQSGNPKGRPKEKTLKEFAREFLANMSEDARVEYFNSIDPELVWKMAEGNPRQDTDVTSKGQAIIVLPTHLVDKNGTTPSTDTDSQGSA